MSDVVIKKLDDGPFLVTGPVRLEDGKGNAYDVNEQFAICRCGASKNKPFCDGSHKQVGFKDDSTAK
ncbi:CDGSH iron-sulfur domain-containing protein [Microaerobacter geothermalis]|uniref:CDGSH iron-sulfur domain-containing protein n=1 Tax=Microaerobacter geothermalis TaxID=674972 RepID=UPI001F29E803|nr:CDGSH iron-sulfur domain-containing protein [Microaerobacter geothermalis]MCF6093768.1 CDGSH iron-sulfur domain-containing protein [Microaerobacter geothermalis]